MGDLFPQKGKPKKPPAPTKALLTRWDDHLKRLGIPRLNGAECKRLGAILRTAWLQCDGNAVKVAQAIDRYFHFADDWTQDHGFPMLHFQEQWRGLCMREKREEERKRLAAEKAAREAMLYGKNPPEDPTVAIEKVRETVHKFKALPKPGGAWQEKKA